MKNRTFNKLYAMANGYFWMPCPLCGQYFGGHEWRDYDGKPSSISTGCYTGKGICPDCTRAGRGQRNTCEGGDTNADISVKPKC